MPVLEIERSDAVATLWLANAERRNALGPAFFEELPQRVAELEADETVRAVVLAARGASFSVGLDLKSDIGAALQASLAGGLAQSREQLYALIRRLQRPLQALAALDKPVVAAIHGVCIGGGLDLVCACDVRYASADAVIGLRETRMAIVADLGSLQRLGSIVGDGHLRELAFTGRDVDAAEAARIGLVNAVLPDAESALVHARRVAALIAANSPLAVRGVKRVLRAASRSALRDGLDYVALWNAAFLPSEDLVEAVSAFLQKREPTFQGR
jgi:enoyl-CoA hydratase